MCIKCSVCDSTIEGWIGNGLPVCYTCLFNKQDKPQKPGDVSKYKNIALKIAALVETKQLAYGDSFGKCGDFLKLLYPDSVPIEKYVDMLAQIRIFDKLMRVANQKEVLGENPWEDIMGYALLGIGKKVQEFTCEEILDVNPVVSPPKKKQDCSSCLWGIQWEQTIRCGCPTSKYYLHKLPLTLLPICDGNYK